MSTTHRNMAYHSVVQLMCNHKLSFMQVKAERPAWYLSVICGALLRVIEQVNLRSADYLGFLEKGQLPPARLTLISFEQQLVLEGLQPLTCYLSCLSLK